MKRVIISCIIVVSIIFCFWFFFLRNEKENRLTREGDDIVLKVESYKKRNGHLPDSIQEMGIKIINESTPQIYYEKKDSNHYILWFPVDGETVKSFYSKDGKWEYGYFR